MIPLSIFLLACAAAYLGTIEAAFGALMRLSLRLVAERSRRPGTLGAYLDDPPLLFLPVRLLLGLVTGTATALLSRGFGIDGARSVAVVVLSIVAFVIVCELLLPLAIVGRDPERILEVLLPSFAPVARALAPVTGRIARSVAGATRHSSQAPRTPLAAPAGPGDKATRPGAADSSGSGAGDNGSKRGTVPNSPGSAEDVAANDAAEHEGTIEGEERRLLRSIVDFGGTLVREVMTPRPDIVAIREDATIGDLRALFREQEYSRFPVFRDSLDNIVGFIFIKDLVALGAEVDASPIGPLIRPPVVVPETKRVPELLKQFQRQQTQCAIVVDEYGGTAGLVTIEDLLEEIVGEIRDEYDVESEPIVDEGHGRFVFSGKVSVDEVAQRLGVEIEREGFETVGGYLLHHIGRVPAVGETFDVDGLTVDVLDAERRRINRVRIAKHSTTADAQDTEEKSYRV
jgi:CBS domain containing-hemolysin-like protein